MTYADGVAEGLSLGVAIAVAAASFLGRWVYVLKGELRGLANNPDNVLAKIVERGWQIDHGFSSDEWHVGGERDRSLAVAWEKADACWIARQSVEEAK